MTLRLVLLLVGCSGTDDKPDVPCEDFYPEAWDPLWEDDVRADESIAAWTASGEGAVDPAATAGCVDAPCLALAGPVAASTDLPVNRGLANVLTGTVTTDAPATLTLAYLAEDGAERVLFDLALDAGTTELDETFTQRMARPTIRVTLALDGPGTATLDGFAVTSTRWAPVADAPTGTVRLGFLVHVEDNVFFSSDEAAWRRRARVLEGLSGTLAARGAKLGIQADASFVRGATVWDPDWLDAREAEGAGWSVHIHDESEPEEVEPAIRDGRVALEEAGLDTTDLNGGFVTADWSTAADAGFWSLTAFKAPATQMGLPRVQLQPWRPGDGVGAEDPDGFLAHDPAGPLLYLPGHDIREVDHARFPAAGEAVLSQVLAHAHPEQVNTWYFVLHVDGFGPSPDDAAAYDAYLDTTFADDLAHYDALLATLAPLVDAGAIVYDTPDGMTEAWGAVNPGCLPD